MHGARLAGLALVSLLGGCLFQLDSAILPGMEVEDPGLVGTWVEVEGERVVITHEGENRYHLTYTEKGGKPSRFHASLGRLGYWTVLELFPVIDPENREAWPMARLLMVLERTGDSAWSRMIEVETMKRLLEEDPGHMPHVETMNELVLTAPGPLLATQLQGFLRRADALVSDQSRWHRLSGQ